MKPSVIIRTQTAIDNTETQTKLMTTFFAQFPNGEYKSLNLSSWVETRVLALHDIEPSKTVLSPSECALYHRDWSDCPTYGDFNKNYPKQFLPLENYFPEM